MKALAALLLMGLLAGCSINIVVAPHAVLAIDSDAAQGDTVQAFHATTVEVLP